MAQKDGHAQLSRGRSEEGAARWASFNAAGENEQEARRLSWSLPKRMRLTRIFFAGLIGALLFAVLLRPIYGAARFGGIIRELREAGQLGFYLEKTGLDRFELLTERMDFALLLLGLFVLFSSLVVASWSISVARRVYSASGRRLSRLYGKPMQAGVAVFTTLLVLTPLPYLVDHLWTGWRIDVISGAFTLGALEWPSLTAMVGYAAYVAVAALAGWRASLLAGLETEPAREILEDVGAPSRPHRAAICAKDGLARAAFERLLKLNGFVIVFTADNAAETRTFFRLYGVGADLLILDEDVDDMAQLKLITHIADEANSAIGLVRLGPQPDEKRPIGLRSDQPHGKIVAIEHVTTPTTRGPLIDAATRVANAARRARAAAAPLAEARGELSA